MRLQKCGAAILIAFAMSHKLEPALKTQQKLAPKQIEISRRRIPLVHFGRYSCQAARKVRACLVEGCGVPARRAVLPDPHVVKMDVPTAIAITGTLAGELGHNVMKAKNGPRTKSPDFPRLLLLGSAEICRQLPNK